MGGFDGVVENDQAYEETEEERDADDSEFDPRQGIGEVERIWGANFWNAKLCKIAFGRSPEEVVKRLHNEVAEVRAYLDGALVIPHYDEPTADEVRAIDGRLRPLLLGPRARLGLAR